MDFGHLSYNQLPSVDFTLPPEPPQNRRVLAEHRALAPKVYIGCPRWGVKEWVGKLFPKGTKDADFLTRYKEHFNCIELNATFYNLYDEAAIARWSEKVGDTDFLFCPKFYQGISHESSLTDKWPLTQAFEKSLKAFGNHLGPAFLQLSDRFGPPRKNELAEYLRNRTDLFFLVEVRHPGWFVQDRLEELVRLLQEMGKGLVITDTAGRRDCCHMHLAQPKTMVRFVANNLHTTDYSRIDAWVERIAFWLDHGLTELYFILHMNNEKHSPELAVYLIDKLNATCGLALKKPVLLQQELF